MEAVAAGEQIYECIFLLLLFFALLDLPTNSY